ncbi:MAG: hypothetical protein LBL94_08330, partial [Prevotellaceae bacterium]|nr:hypothetical protein [Prevotellaceae bacterium]
MKTNLFSIWHTMHTAGKTCLLTVAALFGVCLNAFADGTIDINSPASGSGYTWGGATLTITGNGTYTFTGEAAVPTLNFRIATATNLTNVSIILNDVNIKSTNCAFSIGSGTTVSLTLKGTNNLESGY